MCECCEDLIKRSVKRSPEKTNIGGKALGIRIVALPLGPRAPSSVVVTSNEPTRTAVEETAVR